LPHMVLRVLFLSFPPVFPASPTLLFFSFLLFGHSHCRSPPEERDFGREALLFSSDGPHHRFSFDIFLTITPPPSFSGPRGSSCPLGRRWALAQELPLFFFCFDFGRATLSLRIAEDVIFLASVPSTEESKRRLQPKACQRESYSSTLQNTSFRLFRPPPFPPARAGGTPRWRTV